jgi:hypothetical protein
MFSHSSHRSFRSVLSLTAALASSACVGEVPDELAQEDEVTDDIAQEIKGPTTVATAYPEAALLTVKKNGQFAGSCSASVIAPRVVLTAGHCVIGYTEWDVVAPYANNQKASSVKGLRYDYNGLGADIIPDRHDIGLVFLDKDIALGSYPILATTSTTSNILNIGRVNNGVFSGTDLFVSQPVAIADGAAIGFPFDYSASSVIIESGDSGGPDVLPGPAPHTIVAVNSGAGANFQVLARVDLLQPWIQERVTAKSCGPACPNPLDQSAFFVRQLYLDVLAREADSAGAAYYVNALNTCNGAPACLASTRVAIARGFLESPEKRALYLELYPLSPSYKTLFITHCYWNFLGRQPDPAGLAFWLDALNSTGDYNSVVSGFITSAEYRLRFGAP